MPAARRILAATLGAVLLGVVVPPPPARACSCVEWTPPEVTAALARADGAFVGVERARTEPTPAPDGSIRSDQQVQVTFDVESVGKGGLASPVVVSTAAEGASCGLEGHGRMAVLVRGSEEHGWSSDLCSVVPVALLADLVDLRAPAERPTPLADPVPSHQPADAPDPTAAATTSPAPAGVPRAAGAAPWSSALRTGGATLALVLAAVALGFVLVRRRRTTGPSGWRHPRHDGGSS